MNNYWSLAKRRRWQQRVVTSTAFGPFSILCLGNLGHLIPSIFIEPGSLVFLAVRWQVSRTMEGERLQMQNIFETNCSQSGVGGYWLDSFVWEIALLGNLRMSRVHTVDSSRCFTLHRIAHNQTITNNVSSTDLSWSILANDAISTERDKHNGKFNSCGRLTNGGRSESEPRTNGKFEAYCDIVIGRWQGH